MVSINFEWQHQDVPADDPEGLYAAAAERERLEFRLRYARAAASGASPETGTWIEVDADPAVVAALACIEAHDLAMTPKYATRRAREKAELLASGGAPCADCGQITRPGAAFCGGCGVKLAAT